MDPNTIYTLEKAAEALYTTPDTLSRFARSGELQGIRLGKSWIFRGEYLISFLDTRSGVEASQRRSHRIHEVSAVAFPPAPRSRRRQLPDLS
ncbi:helix-turn-helix domain-containing protein [Massilia sp. S19_KUP03_FR1]|uniref:helix-turn-helix domain-containing protein n=1 Tax=Massilia sp. S19_KUP03_FR1 TaxID=3025503 RepID=UPI003FA59E17